jgi:hypothetical protein
MSNNNNGTASVHSNDPLNIDFSFKYIESGGLAARYLLISYDSKTNILTSSTDISGSNISQKPLDDIEKSDLKNVITENEFLNGLSSRKRRSKSCFI